MNPSRIDLDEIVRQLPAWNLVITIDNTDYPVRELRVSDLKTLQPDQPPSGSDLLKFVESLFEGKRPSISGWSLETLGTVVAIVARYAADRSAKSVGAAGAIQPSISVAGVAA